MRNRDPLPPLPEGYIPPPRHVGVEMMETLTGILDTMEDVDCVFGGVAASRANLIESARLMSEALARQQASDGAQPLGTEPKGWNTATRLRRELVFDIAARLRIPERSAETLIGESRALLQMLKPTHTALGDGEISYRHAQVIIDVTAGLDPEVTTGFEAILLPVAKELTVAKFKEYARRRREALHPERMAERHRAAVAERTVMLDPQPDGMALLSALLPAESAVAAHERITRIAMALAGKDNAGGTGTAMAAAVAAGNGTDGGVGGGTGAGAPGVPGAVEDRTLAQRRADVLTDLLIDGDTCATGDTTSHGIRPQVLISVPVLTMAGESDAPAHLNGYGPISPETARRLCGRAPSFARILTDPVTSAILDFDRTKYAVPADLKAVLHLQFETCSAPGCSRPAHQCDSDHTTDFAHGGTTCLANLAPLCRKHHNLKHHSGVRVRKRNDGTMEWTTPTGKVVIVRPSNLLGAEMLKRGSPGAGSPGGNGNGEGEGEAGGDGSSGSGPPNTGPATGPPGGSGSTDGADPTGSGGSEWDTAPPPDEYPF